MTNRWPSIGRTTQQRDPDPRPPFWRRRWFLIAAGIFLLLLIVGALSGDPEQATEDRAADRGKDAATPTPTPSPIPDPAEEARVDAGKLVDAREYLAAVDVLEDAGLRDTAIRVRRQGTRTLLAAARRALRRGQYQLAKSSALDARQLRRTSAVLTVLTDANAGIARVRAEARDRRRQARLELDLATCTTAEKDTVRAGGGTPAGCAQFAADLEDRRAAQEAEENAASQCDPNYAGACLDPSSPDYDCEGGSGDGPDYTGEVTVVGEDPYELNNDPEEDSLGCEPY
jgi:hypothetical protein